MTHPNPSFTDRDAEQAWNHGAVFFDEFVESGEDHYRLQVHGPALLRACGPLSQKSVLDLGSGQGYFCRQLAARGAHVSGIDISEKMIELARGHEAEEPLGIEYVTMSASNVLKHWEPATFDLVTACMSLQDMADPDGVSVAAHRLLRRDGRFVFSVPHPMTEISFREWERHPDGSKIALRIWGYFDTGRDSCHWNMPRLTGRWTSPYWRRTLEQWSDMVAAAGFSIRRLLEPRPTSEQVAANPNLLDCYELPYFLIFDLQKSAA